MEIAPTLFKAEPCVKSNQCYFHRHSECWMSKLCDCNCHQVPAALSTTNGQKVVVI
jgi:hypothetical protein